MNAITETHVTCYITHGINRCAIRLPQSEVDSIVANGWMVKCRAAEDTRPVYRTVAIGPFKTLWRKYGVVL